MHAGLADNSVYGHGARWRTLPPSTFSLPLVPRWSYYERNRTGLHGRASVTRGEWVPTTRATRTSSTEPSTGSTAPSSLADSARELAVVEFDLALLYLATGKPTDALHWMERSRASCSTAVDDLVRGWLIPGNPFSGYITDMRSSAHGARPLRGAKRTIAQTAAATAHGFDRRPWDIRGNFEHLGSEIGVAAKPIELVGFMHVRIATLHKPHLFDGV